MSFSNRPAPALSLANLRLDRRRLLLMLALGVLTCVLLVVLSGGQAALAAVTHADWPLILLAIIIHYSSFAVRGQRWQRLLAMVGHRLNYWYVTTLLLAGWFVSALLPARAGDLMRMAVLRLDTGRHAPVPVADSLSTIVLERVLDILAIMALGAGFGFVVLRDELPAWLLTSYAVGLGLLIGLVILLVLVPPVLTWLRRISTQRLWQAAINFAERFVLDVRMLFRQPVTALIVVGESLYIWLADALVLWLVVMALGAAVPLAAAAFVALTVDVLAAVPLTPGGIGQIDAAYASLLALLPLPPFNIGAAVLVVRFITYWSFLAFSGAMTVLGGFGAIFRDLHGAAAPAEGTAIDASSSVLDS